VEVPGTYRIVANMGTPHSGVVLAAQMGGRRVQADVAATGSDITHTAQELG
jgi:hypothetical protein